METNSKSKPRATLLSPFNSPYQNAGQSQSTLSQGSYQHRMKTIEELQDEIKTLKAKRELTTIEDDRCELQDQIVGLMFDLAKLYKKQIKLK